jgi:gliding motility-associated-like protein
MSTFNYTVASLTDANNCSAAVTGMSGSRKADVYRVPVANAGPQESFVCGTAVTLAAVPSDGTGTWTFPAQVTSGNASLPNAAVVIASFSEPRVTYKFYWQEMNWNCSSRDSINISFDHEIVNINAGEDDANLRSSDYVIQLHADPIQSYEAGTWSLVEGSGEIDPIDETDPWVTNVALGVNKYKWTVENGECTEEDIVTYIISNLQVPQLISPNGDTKNDTLKIKGLNFDTQTIELTILNGAGTHVFSTSNANGNGDWIDWTGKNSKGDELPEGTYYYLLKVSSPVKAPGLAPWKDSGFIILKRK